MIFCIFIFTKSLSLKYYYSCICRLLAKYKSILKINLKNFTMFKKHFLDILCNGITYFAEGA